MNKDITESNNELVKAFHEKKEVMFLWQQMIDYNM